MVVTDAELVARANGAAVGEHDLQQFFALYVLSGFVFKRGNNTLGAGVDDVAGGGISAAAVDAEGDPAGLVAQFDARRLLRRHHGGIEDMNAAVGAVGKPQLFFVGRERNAVAGAAMPLGRPFLIASNLDAMQHCPVLQSPTSKASNSLTLTKQRVWLPLIVNGRMELLKGPIWFTTVWVFVSATERMGDRRPAR